MKGNEHNFLWRKGAKRRFSIRCQRKRTMAKYIIEDIETCSDESYLDDSNKENCDK